MSDYCENLSNVGNWLSEPALYEQLAEECAELSKAALKMARILRKENPTPLTEEQVYENFIEEITDIQVALDVLGVEADKDLMLKKSKRWSDRVLEKYERYKEYM